MISYHDVLHPETKQTSLPAPPPRISLFGIAIDPVTMGEALERVLGWLDESPPACRYVVTPNVDHVVLLQTHDALRAAYAQASLVIADGWPVVTASRWLGRALPERVAGSDLVPNLLASSRPDRELRVFLLGAAPGVATVAAARIEQRWPYTKVVGTYSPPLGFERSTLECERIVALVNDSRCHLLVVGLGAPKQELWIHEHATVLQVQAAVCAGATIDFLAGHRRRAPRWVQTLRLEWLYRLGTEPRRLFRRYLHDAWRFPVLFIRELRAAQRR